MEEEVEFRLSRFLFLPIWSRRLHRFLEETLQLGAGVWRSPSPCGSSPVSTWDTAEPRRAVRPGLCRAGWGPAGTPAPGDKGRTQGRRQSPSRRTECAWWRESKQHNRVLTADTQKDRSESLERHNGTLSGDLYLIWFGKLENAAGEGDVWTTWFSLLFIFIHLVFMWICWPEQM